MKEHFETLVQRLESELPSGIQFIASMAGENSDFVRFNHGRVRQAGSVEQGSMSIRLISGRRHTAASFSDQQEMNQRILVLAGSAVSRLLDILPQLPEDPFFFGL